MNTNTIRFQDAEGREIVVEERDTCYVVLIHTSSGTTRVGAPYRSKFRAIQAAQRLAGGEVT